MTEVRFNECLKRFRRGDNEGFAEIYNHYKKLVYASALLITRNNFWAEEVASMLFADFVKQAKNPDLHIESPDSYIYRMTKNISEKVRLAEEFKRAELDDNVVARDSATEDIDYIMDFERALSGLSDKHKECAIMHYVYGKRHKEIAKKLGETEKEVEQYFVDIQAHLKKYFQR